MQSKRGRLDRFISKALQVSLRQVRVLLIQKKIKVDGVVVDDGQYPINAFSTIECDEQILRQLTPVYLMFNKPKGIVCATKDHQHSTVLDSIDHPLSATLHIVGRLDLNSTGLVLLTNDSDWSKHIMSPDAKVIKKYRVTVAHDITPETVAGFKQGLYFEYEGITTKPVDLNMESPRVAHLSLMEGKYHQIKRMFGRFRNPVVALHRYQVGALALEESLFEGQFRPLTIAERDSLSTLGRSVDVS